MSSLVWFSFGAWVMGLVWLVVDLAAKRIKEARRADGTVVFPSQHLETITETALRTMLMEALRAGNQALQSNDP